MNLIRLSRSIVTILCVAWLLWQPHNAVQGGDIMAKTLEHEKYTNKLAGETSPYLLQHAHNPVNWYPWGTEVFERARKENKPMFLSIGYSTCHWCHVMERESFSNERIAKIMNEHFVCIKVDREQRPDVDSVYMSAVQMMTGSVGWPLSVFLTPQGKPFYGGTYFPPHDMYGRTGFDKVLLAIAEAWKNNEKQIIESAGKINVALEGLVEYPIREKITPDLLTNAYEHFARTFDGKYGGFGRAPKFPQASNLSMLLGYWHRNKNEAALEMVEVTLNAMAKGGIYDHLGGGFHRYSTDGRWLVPHFEKMLYDQALLSTCYIQAYQATGKETYARVAREVFDYVLRDMTDPGGGFYSAEDADSEGKEGIFYVWEPNEIETILGKEKARVFNEYYGVTTKGNFEDKKSILNITASADELAKRLKMDVAEFGKLLTEAKPRLLAARSTRIGPLRDDKVIAGWNGMMISSLACGGAVLGEEKYVNAAAKAADFVLNSLRHNGRLMRYYRNGKAVEQGFLDDYACMTLGLLDLYEATFDAKWLAHAKELAEKMIELFADEKNGGFFLAAGDSERLIVRNKPAYDGAVPSGNSVAALALLKLGRMTMDERFALSGAKVLEVFSRRLLESPASLSAMLMVVDFQLGPTQEIVIAGKAQQDDTRQMVRLLRSTFLPNSVLLLHQDGPEGKAIEEQIPLLKWQSSTDGKATAYVCENFACRRPLTDIDELKKALSDLGIRARPISTVDAKEKGTGS